MTASRTGLRLLGACLGDLLDHFGGLLRLIDAGGEYQYYASDITRTFPVNGRFSAEQRAVYEVVLEAQDAALARCRPGNHWNDPHDAAVQSIYAGTNEIMKRIIARNLGLDLT